MGMNMVSKGVQNVLDFLQNDFPDMEVIGISGEFFVPWWLIASNLLVGENSLFPIWLQIHSTSCHFSFSHFPIYMLQLLYSVMHTKITSFFGCEL